ncbi:MAG: YraN family protein [Deltaproteobacteria bacterium]|nr:YraN family protein [Deltaproteobacteria bacterium]
MAVHKQVLGKEGEEIAERYLKNKGFKLLERNYRCPVGELDVIALDRKVLVFVEVRTRTSDGSGSPLESVDRRKQRQIIKTASYFLSQKRLHDHDARFDVVGISMGDGEPVVEHIRNAFEVRWS